uniref:Uncharacterized protein n=1 Tax=Schistocephalus solidus TaxID=70667 RepID=A0A0X3NSE7_SCHSO
MAMLEQLRYLCLHVLMIHGSILFLYDLLSNSFVICGLNFCIYILERYLCAPTVFAVISLAAYLGLHPVASKKVNTHVIFILTEILASYIRKRNTSRLSAVPDYATDSSKAGFDFENLKLTNLDGNIESFSISPKTTEHQERYVTASRSRPLSRGRHFIPQLQAIQEVSEEEAKAQEQTEVEEEEYNVHVYDEVYNTVEKVSAPAGEGNECKTMRPTTGVGDARHCDRCHSCALFVKGDLSNIDTRKTPIICPELQTDRRLPPRWKAVNMSFQDNTILAQRERKPVRRHLRTMWRIFVCCGKPAVQE